MDWALLGFKGLGEVLNIHPVFVHFPIALFPTTLLFYFLGIVWKKGRWVFAGRMSLVLAFLSTALTVLTGELAKDSFSHTDVIHHLMMTHEKIGIAALILGAILLFWSFFQRNGFPKARFLFLALLTLTTVAILQNADIGGRMVFVEGASVQAPSIHLHNTHDHHH